MVKTIITQTIGQFTVEVKKGQCTFRNQTFLYCVTITPGRQYFIGRDGQRKYIMEEVFYMDDRAYAMAIYHDYVKFAEEQPFVLVDDQLNPQYV